MAGPKISGSPQLEGYSINETDGNERQVLKRGEDNTVSLQDEDLCNVVRDQETGIILTDAEGNTILIEDQSGPHEELDVLQPNNQEAASTTNGHVIQNSQGAVLPQQENLQFVGATVTDLPGSNATIVEVTQGERIVIGQDQFKVETNAGSVLSIPRTEPGDSNDEYTQTIVLPNVTTNTDAAKYVYTVPEFDVGPLTLILDPASTPTSIASGEIILALITSFEIMVLNENDTNVNEIKVGTVITFKSGVVATVTSIQTTSITNGIAYTLSYTSGSRSSFTNSEMLTLSFPNRVSFTYDFGGDNNSPPTTGQFITDGLEINFNNTDANSVDRSTVLLGLEIGDIITLGTNTDLLILSGPTDMTTFVRFTYSFLNRGSFDFTTSVDDVVTSFGREQGVLEIINEEHYDMNFSLNITNSATFSGTGYQLFLDIDGLNSGTIVDELLTGTTTYNVTVPASIHRGNDIRIREFVPDATTINAITTSWSAGSSWAVDEANISGLQTAKVTILPADVTAGAASVTHNLTNNFLTIWVVYNGRSASPRQVPLSTFTISSLDTIGVTGLATDADIESYTFLIQGF